MASSSARRTHTKKITGAPDYDDAAFWDTKFATGQDVGEWLNSGEALVEAVLSDLERRPLPCIAGEAKRPRVLHLGPGISKLGTKLRDAFVRRGWMGNGIVVSSLSLPLSLHPRTSLLNFSAERRLLQ